MLSPNRVIRVVERTQIVPDIVKMETRWGAFASVCYALFLTQCRILRHAGSALCLRALGTKEEVKDKAIMTTISTVVGADTATGTYELKTLTEYAKLRQHITITTTETATSSGANGLETVAAVVLAGGVAWFLAGTYVGGCGLPYIQGGRVPFAWRD